MDGSGRVLGLFNGTLGRNGCKALLFFDFSRQAMHVEKSLLPGSAEASFRKQDITRLLPQAEQCLESIIGLSRSGSKLFPCNPKGLNTLRPPSHVPGIYRVT